VCDSDAPAVGDRIKPPRGVRPADSSWSSEQSQTRECHLVPDDPAVPCREKPDSNTGYLIPELSFLCNVTLF